MLIVLPPSETKAPGGTHGPLDLSELSFPSLNPIRQEILSDLMQLSVDESLEVLGISEKLRAEAEANQVLDTAPTMPAIHRYTGVLFDALNATSLPASSLSRLAVGSALFGVVGAQDFIPHYRLSGGTKLPASDGSVPTMRKRWGKAITEALSEIDFVLDLRSGTYQNLGKVPGAETVRVETQDGKVVSHFNKKYKGQLARILSAHELSSAEEAIEIAQDAGFNLRSGKELTLVVE